MTTGGKSLVGTTVWTTHCVLRKAIVLEYLQIIGYYVFDFGDGLGDKFLRPTQVHSKKEDAIRACKNHAKYWRSCAAELIAEDEEL